MQKLPLVIVLGAVAFWVIYALRLIKVDLTVVDCLIVNEIEAAQLAGIPLTPDDRKSLIRIAEILQNKAKQADLVITLGA